MSNYTIQDIFTIYGPSYTQTHKLSNEQWKVYNQIRKCKKEEAGFHTYETEEAMLADEIIDVILVATPNDTHRSIALRAMEAGKNVIVEKPATLSLKELTELEDMARKTGRFLTVHQNRRWDEDFLTVREILKDQMGVGGDDSWGSRPHEADIFRISDGDSFTFYLS